MSKIIYDGKGRPIGKIHRKYIYGARGEFLGRYDETSDKTYDARGAFIGQGDQRLRLLSDG